MAAVPLPDAATEKVLDDARSQAAASLKGRFPDSMLAPPPPAAPHVSGGVTNNITLPQEPPLLPSPEPGAGSAPVINDEPHPTQPGPESVPFVEPSIGGFLGEEFKGTGRVVANHVMAGFAQLGKTIAMAGAGAATVADSALGTGTTLQDKAFDFIQNHVNTAYDQWIKQASDQTAGGAAQALGGAAEFVPSITTGVAGAAVNTGINRAASSVEEGQSTKAAAILGVTAALATAAGMKISHAFPGLSKWVNATLQRIVTGAAGNTALQTTNEALDKYILKDQGYKDAADKIDPTDPNSLATSGILGAIFGAIDAYHARKGARPAPKASAPPDLTAGTGEPPPPPPGPNTLSPAPPGGTPINVPGQPEGVVPAPPEPAPTAQPVVAAEGKPSLITDKPSVEPLKDLQAQVADVKDPATARKHVYLSKANVEALGPDGVKTLADGLPISRNFDHNDGVLISQNFSERSKAAALRSKMLAAASKNGATTTAEAMQPILGKLTGAGDGKTAADTVVVQGQTPEGAVATEKMLTPAEAPAAVEEVKNEGKTPVVTTPEAAVARRAEESKVGPVTAEEPAQQPKIGPVEEKPTAAEAPGKEIAPPPATPVSPETGLKEGDRHILKIGGEDVPVVVASKPEGGKVAVHTLDEDGNLSKETHQVPEAMFPKADKPAAEMSTKTPAEEPKSQLGKALASFDQQNTPPQGKKFAGDLSQHAARVAELGRAVLRHIAKTPDLPDPVVDDAVTAANAVKDMDKKSTEAINKGQGISHKLLDAHTEELRRVVANLEDPAKAKLRTEPFQPKAIALKKATTAKRELAVKVEAAKEPAKEAVAQADVELRSGESKPFDAVVKEVIEGVKSGKSILSKGKLGTVYDVAASHWDRVYAAAKEGLAERKVAEQAANVGERVTKTEPVEKVKTAIKDVPDARVLPTLNRGETEKVSNALKRYMNSGEEDVQKWHDNLDRIIHDVYPNHSEHAEMLMENARDQREEVRRAERPAGKMSEQVEEGDLGETRYDPYEGRHSDSDADMRMRAVYGSSLSTSPIGILHEALQNTGLWKHLGEIKDTGKFVSTHKLLDHLASAADKTGNDLMHGLITKLRLHAPDLPIRFVDRVINPRTGAVADNGVMGRWSSDVNSIQVKLSPHAGASDLAPISTVHTILHEIVHAATGYELHAHPDGEFGSEIKRLLAEARIRADRMGMTEASEPKREHASTLYGLTNAHEFMAEALTNPNFQKFLIDSEAHRSGTFLASKGIEAKAGLLDRLAMAITKFFGLKPESSELLRSIMHTTQEVMEKQSSLRDNLYAHHAPDFLRGTSRDIVNRLRDRGKVAEDDHMPGLQEALEKLENSFHDMQDPAPLQHEDEIKSVIGDVATGVARQFRAAVKGGAVGQIRRNVRAFTSHSQLIRTALRRGIFGTNDTLNPLRQYDDALQERNATINRITSEAEPIVNARAKLGYSENKALGEFQRTTQFYGIGPHDTAGTLPKKVTGAKGFAAKSQEIQDRWGNLSKAQRDVYDMERDFNERTNTKLHKAGTDLALDSFSDTEVTKAQRQLLYSVRDPSGYESVIGKGKAIDVGDRNDKLIESLRDFAGTHNIKGDYFHMGRTGDHVVQINKEGVKAFQSEGEAQAYAQKIRDLSPNSKAKYELLGGQHTVDYHAEYVSMHKSEAEAIEEAERLRAEGHEVGSVTQKVLSEQNAPLSSGMQQLAAEATRRIERGGQDDNTRAVGEALRQSFLHMMAARSAYAGSKLARRNVGGVKGEEMGRNFASHAQSLAWNIGQMAHTIRVGEAMGRLREAVKDVNQPQHVASDRGRTYDELMRRVRQEQAQAGSHTPFNSTVAKLGFINFMTSMSHSLLYLTQNFTTAIPVAMARHGFKAADSFRSSMALTSSPAFRETYRALVGKGDVAGIQRAILGAVAADKRFGKWAHGGAESPLQQLIDRGAIHTSLSNQIAVAAKGGNPYVNRVMEYARIMPSMADMFNRVSTGLAALELHKGDVYRAGDFIKETHMDYSQDEKPRAFRAVNKLWGGNSVTMFKTYIQGMAHLLYSHFHDLAYNDTEGGRGQALKVVAGMMIGTALFGGVQRGMGLEPLRLMMWAYNKLAGDKDEYYSFDNMTRRAVTSFIGDNKTAEAINYGLPHLAGIDMSSRMGLSDLFLHDPPDFTSLDGTGWAKFGFAQLGPMGQYIADKSTALNTAFETGRMDDWASVVPVKAFNNVFDAYRAGTEGKTTGAGAQITPPSPGAAVSHFIGFRTAKEAVIQDKLRTDSDYKAWAYQRKQSLIDTYNKLSPADKQSFWKEKVRPWNQDNPGHKVTIQDTIKARKAISRTEQIAAGRPSRDPAINRLNE